MSGFAIEFWRDGRGAPLENARRMTSALRIFGSDRQAAEAAGPFALSWVQSAGFTPQDKFERQPAAAAERWHLLFLGRLNHRSELAEKIGLDAAMLARTPDCDLALAAWMKWREECRDHLFGGYGMIVCDTQENRFTVMRGFERSQHIYHYADADRIIVSTSTKAIFSDPEIPRQLDDVKIADMLVLNHEDFSRSVFKGVSVVGLGQTLTVTGAGEPSLATHDFFENVNPIRLANDDDYVEQARDLLGKSLESAFRTPSLPAISLSAGLDSTSLAVAMIERMRRDGTAAPGILKAYTAVPEKLWDQRTRKARLGDESGPVRALADMYPEIDAHFESGEHLAFDQGLDMVQSYADMPLRGAGSSAWSSAIQHRAQQDRVSLMVSGSDGNANLSFAASHILFAQWLRSGNWVKFAREIRQFSALRPNTKVSSVAFQALLTNMPDAMYDSYMRFRGHDAATGFTAFSAIRPEYARDMKVGERLEALDWDDRYRRRPDRRQMMRIMMRRGARHDAGGLIEANRMMHGVELVTPFVDRKLMQFCYAIPDDQFYKNGVDRRLIKRMMRGKLPPEVLGAKRGEQVSDWHTRRKRDEDRMLAEIDRLGDIPEIAQRLDIDRIKQVIERSPDATPVSVTEYPDYDLARYGVSRALAVARFINQVEGRN